jgi:hypothetical protein
LLGRIRDRASPTVTRYLMQSQDLRSFEAIRVHVRLLLPYIGDLEPNRLTKPINPCCAGP